MTTHHFYTDEPETPELTDSEYLACLEAQRIVEDKYKGKSNSFENLMAMRREIIDRFHEIGFKVFVDTATNFPKVEIVERLYPVERGRIRWEAQQGIADKYFEERRKRKKKE